MSTLLVVKDGNHKVGIVQSIAPQPTVLMLSVFGKGKHVSDTIFKFDPLKHPKGAKGLFINTYHEDGPTHAHGLNPGDVFATKAGKAFRVEKLTEKGVKVNPIDLDSGEVKAGYTVLGQDTAVNLIEAAKIAGTFHSVKDLDPGVYVKTAKGKRFKISKHGKWTTVYPVDSHGEVAGKHTVLPPDTVVQIDAPDISAAMSPDTIEHVAAVAAQVNQSQKEAPPPIDEQKALIAQLLAPKLEALLDLYSPNDMNNEVSQLSVMDALNENLGLPGNFETFKQSLYTQIGYVSSDNATLDSIVNPMEPAWYEAVQEASAPVKKSVSKEVTEILPSKIPKTPPVYPSGTGKNTRIRITVAPEAGYVIQRVDEHGNTSFLGTAPTSGKAKKLARDLSAQHEAIDLLNYQSGPKPDEYQSLGQASQQQFNEEDLVVVYGGRIGTVKDVTYETVQNWKGESVQVKRLTILRSLNNGGADVHTLYAQANVWAAPAGAKFGDQLTKEQILQVRLAAGDLKLTHSELLRQPHPEKYTPYLHDDWTPDNLIGATVGDASEALRTIGYREIKPRTKGLRKYVNAGGKRVYVGNDGTTVTAIETPKPQLLQLDGDALTFHGQLEEALATNGGIEHLDPKKAAFPEQRTSHVRQLLYDLAEGRQNNVAEKVKGKVKTDEQYEKEINDEGAVPPSANLITHIQEPNLVLTPRKSVWDRLAEANVPGTIPTKIQAVPGGGDAEGVLEPGVTVFSNGLEQPLQLRVAQNLDVGQTAALMAFTGVHGMADQLIGSSQTGNALVPELQGQTPRAAAILLDNAIKVRDQGQKALLFEGVPEETVAYVVTQAKNAEHYAAVQVAERREETLHRAQIYRAQLLADEIKKRRLAEGTSNSAVGQFSLPLWADVEMEAQDWNTIQSLVDNIGNTPHDVPAFYTGGLIQDGVVYHRARRSDAKIPYEMDQHAISRLEMAGAVRQENPDSIDPGYKGSGKIYNGEAYVLNVGTANTYEQMKPDLSWAIQTAIEEVHPHETGSTFPQAVADSFVQKANAVGSLDELFAGYTDLAVIQKVRATLGAQKRVEYVPHDQGPANAGGAPTNQRGIVRVYGMTPAETADALQELGLVGELEAAVPFKAVMRSSRRHGPIAPIHSDYVSGRAELPKVTERITHGITGANTGAFNRLLAIVKSGGLMSIAERHRMGIKVQSASPAGDIRSGIDDKIFTTIGNGSAVGSGSSHKFVMKRHAYLRRDVTLAPNDFGGSDTRYSQYKTYLNKLQGDVGEVKTNLYQPISPAVRQRHLNTVNVSSSNEYNIGPTIPVEDMEVIAVANAQEQDQLHDLLDQMLSDGTIASKPAVIVGTSQAYEYAQSQL